MFHVLGMELRPAMSMDQGLGQDWTTRVFQAFTEGRQISVPLELLTQVIDEEIVEVDVIVEVIVEVGNTIRVCEYGPKYCGCQPETTKSHCSGMVRSG